MVVDCGGSTVDTTIHEVEREHEQHTLVKEVAPASGGDWGSNTINRLVFKLVEEVFGSNRYQNMMNDPLGHTQLQDSVERAKCSFNGDNDGVIQLPDSLLYSTRSYSIQAIENYNRMNQTKLMLKVFVKKNEIIPSGHIVERRILKVEKEQTQITIEILVSDEDVPPLYTDHSSVKVIGNHTVNIPMNGTGRIATGMLFGDTEKVYMSLARKWKLIWSFELSDDVVHIVFNELSAATACKSSLL
ncbi:hypothetical protein BC938DRAFT_472092 [Jimgerdemannia flammicorona]|uniref:Uncharacterized protein n=1 Tax=Jimgerdemannia flammicorona TaxID=994334 RepID=A0A433QU67_9FUNG|nr:hypothetical protein BC938DRAFT_472092 [Jimgerdemannia flammicorona]